MVITKKFHNFEEIILKYLRLYLDPCFKVLLRTNDSN